MAQTVGKADSEHQNGKRIKVKHEKMELAELYMTEVKVCAQRAHIAILDQLVEPCEEFCGGGLIPVSPRPLKAEGDAVTTKLLDGVDHLSSRILGRYLPHK